MTTAYYARRPSLRRNSPLSVFGQEHGFAADAPMMQRIDVGDSSDDDLPQPMKFSALTKALLESEAPEQLASPEQDHGYQVSDKLGSRGGHTYKVDLDTPVRLPNLKIIRKPSPHLTRSTAVGSATRSVSPRILHVSRGADSAKRSVGSATSFPVRASSRAQTPGSEYVTPGPAGRIERAGRARAGSNSSVEHGSRSHSRLTRADARSTEPEDDDNDVRGHFNRSGSAASGSDAASLHTHAVLARSRAAPGETAHSSMRVKRVPVGAGSFLRGAPVRRGFRRRDSDDHPSPTEEADPMARIGETENVPDESKPIASFDLSKMSTSTEQQPPLQPHSRSSSRASIDRPHANRHITKPPSRKTSTESLSRQANADPSSRRVDSAQSVNTAAHRVTQKASLESIRAASIASGILAARRPSVSQPYKAPPPRLQEAFSDQENMPPPTFKRNKDSDFKILGQPQVAILPATKPMVAETPVPVHKTSPRRALTALSANTPQRPAPPPPPKMTVLDAATKTAGASATKSKKRRAHIVLNGKLFTQLGRLGKGGSSDVYCVMADNHKLFALKRVKLADCDEATVRGYKGEIDLLSKLNDVERVVRLYDWELDEGRNILSVLMERGDGDLNKILSNGTIMSSSSSSAHAGEARLNTPFVRYWWQEMLACVSAIHDRDIVHSDLKPANFVIASGALKLIDFGIANAIDTDNTVNVHRENHVGTPNYMSPESIIDSNAPGPGAGGGGGGGGGAAHQSRLMRLGKPSDVWSLGCILYQMVYGRPPFAHIQSQLTKVLHITNPKEPILFPDHGQGGVPVPAALRGTMRKCLQRDPALRPTVAQLLSEGDRWLFPEAEGRVPLAEDVLGVIIGRVVERCKRGEQVGGDEVKAWADGFLGRVREMVEMEGLGKVKG